MKAIVAALCLVVLCSPFARAETRTADNIVWYRVHLGLGVGKQALSRDVVREFVGKEITSRFPDGLTITAARGQWKSPEAGMIKENTIVIDIQCPDIPENREKIDEIGTAYIKRFGNAKASLFVMRIPNIQTTLWY